MIIDGYKNFSGDDVSLPVSPPQLQSPVESLLASYGRLIRTNVPYKTKKRIIAQEAGGSI